MPTITWRDQHAPPEPNSPSDADHAQIIQNELRAAGATMYGLAKFSSQYLHRIIHHDEHIKGAVYGRYKGGRGLLKLTEGMLVATDRRIIFLDYKPGFTSVEEIAYRAVSGVDYTMAGPFSSVTLHTRIGEFSLRYANSNCIRQFVDYIEDRQIAEAEPAQLSGKTEASASTAAQTTRNPVTPDTLTFLNGHDVAVLSTVDKGGRVHGAAMHYILDTSGAAYLLTKTATRTAQNLLATHQAALTVYDADRLQTVQIHGTAAVEERPEIQAHTFRALCQQHASTNGKYLSPAATLQEGNFIVFRVKPDTVRFIDFALKGDEPPAG